MAIETRWLTVSSPASMCDTCVRIEDLGHVWLDLCNELLELGDLANLFESENLIFLVAIHAKPR